MAISLYDASVTSYLQILPAVSNFMDKALGYFREHGIDPQQIVETRLYEDMHPFHFQIHSVVFHSVSALEGIRNGTFQAPGERPQLDYAGLQALVVEARASLAKLTREEIDAREGTDLVFKGRDSARVFTAEGFLQSFALPNFYFHVTTAYNILRSKGVPVGKRDYIGALRQKT
ncbi:MAG: hypothetical protein JWN04_370 [Myxococcaceae bacterium]|nr:hypothetical protein [Myxococcaceae bacterium]